MPKRLALGKTQGRRLRDALRTQLKHQTASMGVAKAPELQPLSAGEGIRSDREMQLVYGDLSPIILEQTSFFSTACPSRPCACKLDQNATSLELRVFLPTPTHF